MKKKNIQYFPLDKLTPLDCLDIYETKHKKIFNDSIQTVFGVIRSEINKQHGLGYGGILCYAILFNMMEQGQLFDLSREKFLDVIGLMYDNRQKTVQQIAQEITNIETKK